MTKNTLLLALALCSTLAQADIIPIVQSSTYIATARYNGASVSYAESRNSNGPLWGVAYSVIQTQAGIENALNAAIAQKAASTGATFLKGTLTGDPTVTITPQANGTTLINLSGLSYAANTRFSGRQWGVISYDCINNLTLRNFAITAQYGTQSGQMLNDTVGASAEVSSNTECDSNLSWVLPFVGDYIIGRITSQLDAGFAAGIRGSLAKVKDDLLFNRDANYLSGLNRLVPADKVVTLPNGSSFALGQYLQSNLAYLIGNSQLTLKLGKGVQVKPQYGGAENTTIETGNVLDLNLSSPAFSFGVGLVEQAEVEWYWVCSWTNRAKQCSPNF